MGEDSYLAFGDEFESDRSTLLLTAAEAMDTRRAELAPGGRATASAEGTLLRDLTEDVARFAAAPVIHEVSALAAAQHLDVPDALKGLAERSRIFSMYFPLVLRPRRAWAFHRLDLGLRFNPDGADGGSRPKAVEILPNKRFRTLLEASSTLEVRLGAKGVFEAGLPPIPLDAVGVPATVEAAVDAHTAAQAGLLFQPFSYKLQTSEVDHTDVGAEEVFWKLTGGEFAGGEYPAFVVLVQVPQESTTLVIEAAMRVARNFALAGGGMMEAIRSMPAAVKTFLTRGAPISVTKEWNLSDALRTP